MLEGFIILFAFIGFVWVMVHLAGIARTAKEDYGELLEQWIMFVLCAVVLGIPWGIGAYHVFFYLKGLL